LSVGPVLQLVGNKSLSTDSLEVSLAPGRAGWQGPNPPVINWHPRFKDANYRIRNSYLFDGKSLELFIAGYVNKESTVDFSATKEHKIITTNDWWIGERQHFALRATQPIKTVEELNVYTKGDNKLIWQWYQIAGVDTANPVWAKMLEGFSKLQEKEQPFFVIAIMASFENDEEEARHILSSFVNNMYPELISIVN